MFFFFSFFAHSSVFRMDEITFNKQVVEGDTSVPWFIMFGGQNCPACRMALPEFGKAADDAAGFARFAYADASDVPSAVQRFNIKTIPQFIMFLDGESYVFKGQHTSNALMKFIAGKIGEGIEEIDDSWVDRTDNLVLLFHKNFKPPMMFSGAYGSFKGKNITFGISRDPDTFEAFGNPPCPSYWFYKDGVGTHYKGNKDFQSFVTAITEFFDVEVADDEL